MKQSPMKLFDTILYQSRSDRGLLDAEDAKTINMQRLIDIGLVQEGDFAVTYDCGCEDAETTFVEWSENPRDGTLRPFIKCRYCGVTRLDPNDLRTWSVQVSVVVRMIGESLGFTEPFTETIPNIVWQLGRKNRRDLYYVRRFYRDEFPIVRSFLALHPTAILLVPINTDKETYAMLCLNNHCVPVQEFITMDDEYRLTADWSKVEAELEPAEQEQKRPRVKRGNRAANIEKLITEMKEHYRASKSNYYATGSLLPRPTQEEIATRAGIGQRDVSRCLADPDAMLLKLLWKQADDISAVLKS
jgi:hypothetical protein